MGYGKNLADAIASKGWSVSETSRRSGVNANTIHTIIRRDSSVRYDHALRLSNALGIDVKLICKENPYTQTDVETLPDLLPEAGGLLTSFNKNSYVKNRMHQLLNLYSYSEYPMLDQLLAKFYVLDEEGRKEVFNYLDYQATHHTDKEHSENLKKI